MEISYIRTSANWLDVLNSARTTVNKEEVEKEPSSEWKRKILLAEHSPIRKLVVSWKWLNVPYWVSVHIVRHWLGIVHFVRTQRTDRTGVSRDELPQGALVEHECDANAQAMINISRKRLCLLASEETREHWQYTLDKLKMLEPELVSVCVPECIYRGFCPEIKSCGIINTKPYQIYLKAYREGALK